MHQCKFKLGDSFDSILTSGDTILYFKCEECPRVLPVMGKDLVKWSKGETVSPSRESD